jgi:hypothetical protein
MRERGADQLLQPLIPEDLKPFQIGERRRVGRRRWGPAAEYTRWFGGRSAVFRANHAARKQTHNYGYDHYSLIHCE